MFDFSDVINKPIAGYEVNIDTQFEDPILGFIGDVFEDMQDTKGIKDKKYRQLSKKLAEGISNRFGIPMEVSHEYSFFACVPIDQYSNVLIPEQNDVQPDSKSLLKKINDFKKRDIIIDLKKAYISGLEGVYNTTLYLDHDLITNGKLTIGELVAIQVHEIGHAFTYIYHSGKIIKNNVTLLESFLYGKDGLADKASKVLISGSTENSTDDTVLIKALNKENIDTFKSINNLILGSSNSIGKDSETEADAFAVRFGVGEELITALDKLLNINNNIKTLLMTVGIISLLQTVTLIATFPMLATAGNIIAIFTYLSAITFMNSVSLMASINLQLSVIIEIFNLTPNASPYTKLEERMNRMKTELIKLLRTNKIDKEDRNILVSKIDGIINTLNKVSSSNYSNIFAAMYLDIYNYGKDINIEKIYNNTMNKLQNNDLHYLAEKAKDGGIAGNEAEIVDEYKFYTTVTLWSNSYLASVLKDNKDSVDKLNEVLANYRIKLSRVEDNDLEYVVQSDKLYKFKDGITSMALVPMDKTDDVIGISVDWFKTVFHIENKYIDVKEVNKVNVKEDYCIYIIKEKQYDFEKDTTKNKNLNELKGYSRKLFRDYGELPIVEEIDMIIKHINNDNIKVPREVKEQLSILLDLIVKYELVGNNGYDLHFGNFAYDVNGRIILMDTIFSNKAVALKLNNCIELPEMK